MKERRRFSIASFVAILGVNFALMVGAYLVFADTIWERNLLAPFFGAGIAGTLFLWAIVVTFGRRYIARAAEFQEAPSDEALSPSPKGTPPTPPAETSAAVQLLSILQRQGRLIDFLQEDLSRHDDAQIGAAVRSIHAGLKSALAEHVVLEPVFEDAEGTAVVIDPGFDPGAIRLTGDVTGDPPFRGEVRHRGWRVVRVDLPKKTVARDGGQAILAPAEVEVKSPAR